MGNDYSNDSVQGPGRIAADDRTDGPISDASVPVGDRGGTGHETDGPESNATAAHSSRGFRRALFKSGHTSLIDKMSTPDRQGFAQGGGRHGLHLGNTARLDATSGKMAGPRGNKLPKGPSGT